VSIEAGIAVPPESHTPNACRPDLDACRPDLDACRPDVEAPIF